MYLSKIFCYEKILLGLLFGIKLKASMQEKTEYNMKLYRKWRDVQRDQLGNSANIFFLFASGILAFSVNYLLNQSKEIDSRIKVVLYCAIILVLISVFFYGFFGNNRLNDFRRTARLLGQGLSEKEVGNKTKEIGERTWIFYNLQKWFLYIGFLSNFIAYSIIIFS